jgi:hypothetical protein
LEVEAVVSDETLPVSSEFIVLDLVSSPNPLDGETDEVIGLFEPPLERLPDDDNDAVKDSVV